MPFSLLIGSLAGAAAAVVLMASVRSAQSIGPLLLVIAPLPGLIAGLGWGLASAIAAALAGAAVMAFAGGAKLGLAHILFIGAPCALLAHLAFLSRPLPPTAASATPGRDWYPAGRLLAAIGLVGGTLPVVLLPMIGDTYAVLAEPFALLLRTIGASAPADSGLAWLRTAGDAEIARYARALVRATPAALAAYWTIFFAINFYLAGRITRASGRLARDWPDLPGLVVPPALLGLFAAALAAMFVAGTPAVIGTSLAGALAVVFVMAGLAVVHAIARGRWPWLVWAVYCSLMLTVIGAGVALIVLAIGIVEPVLNLRRRLPPQRPTGT